MNAHAPRAGVVIVNYNAGEYLALAVESLLAQTVLPRRIVVVDNASNDASIAGFAERFPSVELVALPENVGFAAANNLGVDRCADCEFVALLNPDAFPQPEWLETLVAAADRHPEYAVFGSRLLLHSDVRILDGTGDCYHVNGLAFRRDIGAVAEVQRPTGETFSSCAAAALYRREAFIAVEGFDESFFCYYEDTDLAFRLRLAGYRCLYVADAIARHVGSATAGQFSEFTVYHSARNQMWVFLKNMPGALFWLYLPQHLLMNALTVIAYLPRRRARAALAGKRDAIRDLPRVLRERRRIQTARRIGAFAVRRSMSRGPGVYFLPFVLRVRAQRQRRSEPVEHAAAAASTERPRLPHLDGLRALAALFVVFHHAWLTIWPDLLYPRLPAVGRLALGFAFGHFGVAVFIVLSGFCLGLPVARAGALPGGARRFFRRRARRILPPYYASVALSLLLVWTVIGGRTGTHWDISVPVDWRGYVGSMLLADDVLGGGQVNHVWWSVALEWQIYILLPLLVACWLRFGAQWSAALAAALSLGLAALLAVLPTGGPLQLGGVMPWFIALFGLGLLGAAIAESDARSMRTLRDRTHWGHLAALACLGMVAACVAAGREVALAHIAALDLVVGAATVFVILAGCEGDTRLRRALSFRPLIFVGSFSYSLYLVHAPLLQVVWQYGLHPLGLGTSATFVLLAVVGVPLVVAASYLFFLLCERPFLSTRRGARRGSGVPVYVRSGKPVVVAPAVLDPSV
jgi:GT2 family glycosyltransferase/peptidoglycan/LPS O-acetylase OafA/YrhL